MPKNKIWWLIFGLIATILVTAVVAGVYINKYKKEAAAASDALVSKLQRDLATTTTINTSEGATLTIPKDAKIIGALYGAYGGVMADVTDILQAKVSSTADTSVVVNPTNLGTDPAPGQTKRLTTTFQS